MSSDFELNTISWEMQQCRELVHLEMTELAGVESPGVETLLRPVDRVIATRGHAYCPGSATPTYRGRGEEAGRGRLVAQLVVTVLPAGVHRSTCSSSGKLHWPGSE